MIEFILFVFNFNKELFTKTSKGSTDFNNQNFNVITFIVYAVLSVSLCTSYFSVTKVIKLSIEHVKLSKDSKELVKVKKELADTKLNLDGCKDVVKLMMPPTPEEDKANKEAIRYKKKMRSSQKVRDKAHQVTETTDK